jgi:hypothetical protein
MSSFVVSLKSSSTLLKKTYQGQVWLHMPVIPTYRGQGWLRQKDYKFKASLGYILKLCLKKEKKKTLPNMSGNL